MKLAKQILRLSGWSAFAGFSNSIILALLYFFLTTLLSQEDFGVYAIASSLILLGASSIENSFSVGILKGDRILPEDYSSIYTINLIFASIASVILLLVTFFFNTIFGIPNLVLLLLVLVPILFLIAYNSPQIAGMKKNLLFKKLAIFDLVSLFFFSVTAVSFALFNYGYWSLIFGLSAKYLSYTLLIILTKSTYCTIRPIGYDDRMKEHFRFGKYVMSEKLLTSGISYIDVFLVGIFLNIEVLGAYDILKKIILRPFILAYQYLEDVLFPILSQIKESVSAYNNTYRTFIAIIGLIFLPLFTLIYINAFWLVGFLPEEYAEFTCVVKLLIVFAVSIILLNPLDMIMYGFSKSREFFIWYLFISLIQIIISIIALQYSIELFLILISIYYFLVYLLAFPVLINKLNTLSFLSYYSLLLYISPYIIILCLAQNCQSFESIMLWAMNGSVLLVLLVSYFSYVKFVQKT